MPTREVSLAAALVAAGLFGCDNAPEMTQLTFEEVRQKAVASDDAAFKAWFEHFKGKGVAWSGQVVEARSEVEDDFMRSGRLFVDLDPPSASAPQPDVEFPIKASRLDSYPPGRAVKFTAVLREVAQRQPPLLRLEARAVE